MSCKSVSHADVTIYTKPGAPVTLASVIIVTWRGQHCGGVGLLTKESSFTKTGTPSLSKKKKRKMFLAYLFVLIVSLATIANGGGIGKAWEVSPVQKPDHPASLSSRPRLESSAFEVLSVSGVGRLAPSTINREKLTTKSPMENITTKIPLNPNNEGSNENANEEPGNSRVAKELEDLEDGTIHIPEIDFHDSNIEEFIRRAREDDNDDVEALPSLWRNIRRQERTGRNHGVSCAEVEEIDRTEDKEDFESMEEKSSGRHRRETETEMEKIGASTSVREARLSSPEVWSKQPLSVEFRHRTKLEEVAEEDEKSSRSTSRGLQAPHVDFVTANRRSFTENRESRDLPLTTSTDIGRSYDEMPIYRNTLRDRDLDAPYTRGLFYPERYRTERDYFVRGPSNEPNYRQDRYREVDFDLYGRNRPMMPKPKRIIYYATLPEVVRKPVDLRSYSRPYDAMMRSTNTPISSDRYYKRRAGTNDSPSRYRYYAYPHGNYENYDLYGKRPAWNERPYGLSYPEKMADYRRREQDLDHASMKDTSRNEESMLELGQERKIAERPKSRERHQDKLPWPVQIGTEVSVKENERVTGRKIFGQRDDYDRFRNNGRMDRERESSGSMETRN